MNIIFKCSQCGRGFAYHWNGKCPVCSGDITIPAGDDMEESDMNEEDNDKMLDDCIHCHNGKCSLGAHVCITDGTICGDYEQC